MDKTTRSVANYLVEEFMFIPEGVNPLGRFKPSPTGAYYHFSRNGMVRYNEKEGVLHVDSRKLKKKVNFKVKEIGRLTGLNKLL